MVCASATRTAHLQPVLDGGLQVWPGGEHERIFRAMLSRARASIDTQLANLIVAWARRQWPALRLVPARWIRPAVAPAAMRLRRVLSAASLTLGATIGVMLVVLAILP